VCHIVARLLAKNREDRYPSPLDLMAALDALLAEGSSSAP
jgi:hypothetical protein